MRKSIATLGICLFVSAFTQQIYQAQPTDDVWYYDNAFNPGFTAFLRVWGDGTNALDPTGARPALNYSYSLAKWRLNGIPAGRQYQVIRAQITVVQTQPPGYTQQEGEQYPLEARPLSRSDFTEAGWDYNAPNNPEIGATLFGEGQMTSYRTDAPFPIVIPLDSEAFEPYFNAAVNQNNGALGIGFVSRMDPGGQGGTRFYRFYSRNDTGGRGPVLQIVYRVAGDVSGDGCTDDADLLTVLFNFGSNNPEADLNGDGVVDDADLLTVLFYFGNGCEP
ncbi:MAG: hypothetical protein CFK49_06075 [Armatimonadetes bacterium JP3_11]|jgi:hypothetical protein|nr:MAG: hypothetical protein CFK49_06075 [Armatimonadetes bacterium JP3_11]RMH09246.1 MAG: hypothetical protein D6697_04155 [Armatimonadota bacterium]